MATPEHARLALYNRLGEVLGPKEADTFMSIVADHSAELLATKDDIARLEMHLTEQISGLRLEMQRELRAHMRYNLATMVAMTGIFSVIVGLIT